MNSTDKTIHDGLRIASWIILAVTLALTFFFAREVLVQRDELAGKIDLDQLDLPLLTRLAFVAPQWGIKLVAGAAMFILGIKELLFRWKMFKLTVNVASLAGILFLLLAFHRAVVDIFLQLY